MLIIFAQRKTICKKFLNILLKFVNNYVDIVLYNNVLSVKTFINSNFNNVLSSMNNFYKYIKNNI